MIYLLLPESFFYLISRLNMYLLQPFHNLKNVPIKNIFPTLRIFLNSDIFKVR